MLLHLFRWILCACCFGVPLLILSLPLIFGAAQTAAGCRQLKLYKACCTHWQHVLTLLRDIQDLGWDDILWFWNKTWQCFSELMEWIGYCIFFCAIIIRGLVCGMAPLIYMLCGLMENFAPSYASWIKEFCGVVRENFTLLSIQLQGADVFPQRETEQEHQEITRLQKGLLTTAGTAVDVPSYDQPQAHSSEIEDVVPDCGDFGGKCSKEDTVEKQQPVECVMASGKSPPGDFSHASQCSKENTAVTELTKPGEPCETGNGSEKVEVSCLEEWLSKDEGRAEEDLSDVVFHDLRSMVADLQEKLEFECRSRREAETQGVAWMKAEQQAALNARIASQDRDSLKKLNELLSREISEERNRRQEADRALQESKTQCQVLAKELSEAKRELTSQSLSRDKKAQQKVRKELSEEKSKRLAAEQLQQKADSHVQFLSCELSKEKNGRFLAEQAQHDIKTQLERLSSELSEEKKRRMVAERAHEEAEVRLRKTQQTHQQDVFVKKQTMHAPAAADAGRGVAGSRPPPPTSPPVVVEHEAEDEVKAQSKGCTSKRAEGNAWEQYTDPTSGKVWWWNSVDQKVSWTNPHLQKKS